LKVERSTFASVFGFSEGNPMTSDGFRVIGLQAENFKRLRAVSLRAKPGLNVIAGRNAQGKSSVLDAIAASLGGAKAAPEQPIRNGASRAEIVVDLGDLKVVRTFTRKGSQLIVTDGGGEPLKSPQGLLDELAERLTFDPMAFVRLKPAEQSALLRRLGGLDLSDLDAKAAQARDDRNAANRETRRLKAAYDEMPHYPDVGLVPVSAAELIQQLSDAAEDERRHNGAKDRLAAANKAHAEAYENVRRLEAELAKARLGLGVAAREVEDAETDVRMYADVPDTSGIRAKLEGIEGANAKVGANAAREAKRQEYLRSLDESDRLESQLSDLEAERKRRLEAATFPLPELSVDGDVVSYNGIPLEQASQAERVRIGCAIGAALHPQLRVVLVREGSFLDDDSLDALAAWCDETGMQAWVEVTGTAKGGVLIEDGRVADTSDDSTDRDEAPSLVDRVRGDLLGR
jgi:hypothetical protein